MVISPKFRIYFIAIIILSGIAGYALCENSQMEERISNQRIGISELEFQDVNLQSSGFSGYEFVGRIKNNSKKHTLYSVEINVIFYDCVKKSGDRNCIIIGERKESIYLTIPPKQERDFKEPIYLYGDVLNPEGDLVWHYKVLSTRSDKGNKP
jgi:hypothetical protein